MDCPECRKKKKDKDGDKRFEDGKDGGIDSFSTQSSGVKVR
jgi:hypothetical protein